MLIVLLWLIFASSSMWLIWQDMKYQKVEILSLIIFVISCYCVSETKNFCFFPLWIFILVQIIFYMFRKILCFGLADYFVVTGCCAFLTAENWNYFLLLCGLFGCCFGYFFRKKYNQQKFPFIPAIIIATILTWYGC